MKKFGTSGWWKQSRRPLMSCCKRPRKTWEAAASYQRAALFCGGLVLREVWRTPPSLPSHNLRQMSSITFPPSPSILTDPQLSKPPPAPTKIASDSAPTTIQTQISPHLPSHAFLLLPPQHSSAFSRARSSLWAASANPGRSPSRLVTCVDISILGGWGLHKDHKNNQFSYIQTTYSLLLIFSFSKVCLWVHAERVQQQNVCYSTSIAVYTACNSSDLFQCIEAQTSRKQWNRVLLNKAGIVRF